MVLCWYCLLIVSGTLCVFCLWKVVYKYFSYSLTSGFYHVWSVFLFLLAKAICTFTAYHIISFWVYSVWKVLVADLQTTLSLRVLFIHDPLLLCSLLLLPPCLGCLLTLSVSLLQEVLFHTGTVFISFLFALNIQEWLKKKKKEAKTLKHYNSGCTVHTSLFRRSFLTLSML